MDFPVYFFERELDKFLRVLDTNDAEHKDLATAYDTLYAQVKSGFGGALEVVTPELIKEFYSHTETKLEESMPQSRTRIWLSCLRDEIAALLPIEETEKDDDDDDDDDDIMNDPDIREMVKNGEHICYMFNAHCPACFEEPGTSEDEDDEEEDEDEGFRVRVRESRVTEEQSDAPPPSPI